MTTAPLKSRLTLGARLGLCGVAAMVAALALSLALPQTARIFIWLAGLVALAGAAVLMRTGVVWYRRLKARERRDGDPAAADGSAESP